MYSREKRLKAVELYIKYDKSAADVIRELGYPVFRPGLFDRNRLYMGVRPE